MLSGTACRTFVVEDVNYAQQIESVLHPDENGNVEDVRHGISFNVNPFLVQEFGEQDSVEIDEIRLIRNEKGFYFITANKFKHVYVMEPAKSKLKLSNKIKVSETGLTSAAFNLRSPFIQLIDRQQGEVLTLNEEGIMETQEEEKS
jgi:hypothetical protein